jgi:ligand-binding sensor domain-containing protein
LKKTLLLIFLLFSIVVTAQHRIGNFIAYSKGNGLAQSAYHNVFETSDGYWWVSSNDGVYRFDGKRFELFNSLYYNSNSPTDNNIVDLEEDNAGNLWMAGFTKGVTKYNLKTGKYKQYPVLSVDSNKNLYGTFRVYKDTEGTLWVGTMGRGLAKYNETKDNFSVFYPDTSKSKDGTVYDDNVVSGIIEDNLNKDILWLSCFDGLYSFNKKNNQFSFYKEDYVNDPVKTLHGFLAIEQTGNFIYLGTWFAGLGDVADLKNVRPEPLPNCNTKDEDNNKKLH